MIDSESFRQSTAADAGSNANEARKIPEKMVCFTMVDMVSGSEKHTMERAAGIEPACLAWKARALPLSYARAFRDNQTASPPR